MTSEILNSNMPRPISLLRPDTKINVLQFSLFHSDPCNQGKRDKEYHVKLERDGLYRQRSFFSCGIAGMTAAVEQITLTE